MLDTYPLEHIAAHALVDVQLLRSKVMYDRLERLGVAVKEVLARGQVEGFVSLLEVPQEGQSAPWEPLQCAYPCLVSCTSYIYHHPLVEGFPDAHSDVVRESLLDSHVYCRRDQPGPRP